MASDAVMDDYLVYDNRLASFTAPQAVPAKQRRTSSASASSRAPKALSWPHKSIRPADMAKAGFIFQPLPSNPDNVVCFLCNKALDGWEQDDSPLEEHLKHSPECGWAITAAVEAELGGYAAEDPRDPLMVEARTATFAGRWPHEAKKGWSCKTKQLVEAGWKYTPLVGSEDNATCAYCQLALDGWEKKDKPWDEHYSRAPNCPFFSLISSKPAPKRAGRSKAARSSKASRLSLQSVATDMTSVADVTADIDDSVMTTASNVTTASKASKKTTKGRKPAASRGKKTRTKKDEVVEILEDESAQEEEMPPPPPPKPGRGKKRNSDEVEGSVVTNAEAPVPKKRATKTRKARGSTATEVSQADTEMVDVPEPTKKPAAKKATRKASGTRKASTKSTRKVSVARTVSTASPPPQVPDDDEIDRALQADLDRPLIDDEDGPNDADPETKKAAAARKRQSAEIGVSQDDDLLTHTSTTDFAMFDPAPMQPTDAEIEADLQSMQDEMDIDQAKMELVTVPDEMQASHEEQKPAEEELKAPKKGRKAGARKVSKQTTTRKTKEVAAAVEQPQTQAAPEAEEPDELAEAEVSIVSSGTVVRRSVGRASLGSAAGSTAAKPPAKRGRPPKKKVSQVKADEPAEVAAPPEPVVQPEPEVVQENEEPVPVPTEEPKKPGKRGRPAKKSKISEASSGESTILAPPAEPEPKPAQTEAETVEIVEASVHENLSAASGSPRIGRKPVPAPKDSPFAIQRKALEPAPTVGTSAPIVPPKTPGHHTSPVQSAKQATVSPSPTPQASDAENRPPSSKPNTNSSKGKRMPLGELPAATPTRQQASTSPSKQPQNPVGGLQGTEKWTAVDLELIFEDQENAGASTAADRFFAKGGELTDDERNMTVEEWIYHNAGQAEQKLKHECETMVMAFEREGTRAMGVLEGLMAE